jgi:hypothetical protein
VPVDVAILVVVGVLVDVGVPVTEVEPIVFVDPLVVFNTRKLIIGAFPEGTAVDVLPVVELPLLVGAGVAVLLIEPALLAAVGVPVPVLPEEPALLVAVGVPLLIPLLEV